MLSKGAKTRKTGGRDKLSRSDNGLVNVETWDTPLKQIMSIAHSASTDVTADEIIASMTCFGEANDSLVQAQQLRMIGKHVRHCKYV